MKAGRFNYSVGIDLTLTRAEYAHLAGAARAHPDCSMYAGLAVAGGFLYRWGRRFPLKDPSPDDIITVRAAADEVGLLCKLCENDPWTNEPNQALSAALREASSAMNTEWARANARPKETLALHVAWPDDPAAGICKGYERVTVTFEGGNIPDDAVEALKRTLSSIYGGATVQGDEEYQEARGVQ